MNNITQNIDTLMSQALLIRKAEQHLLKLFEKGEINGTIHTCIGQELIGVTIANFAFEQGDFLISNHRGHGHFLSCYPEQLSHFFAELLSKQSSICGGHGGSQHLYTKGFLSNGILGSTAPIASGIAYAKKHSNSGNIVTLFLGDGAFGEGVIYEAMNLAAVYELPLYIICESNKISQSTETKSVQRGSLIDRAKGCGLTTFESSMNDLQKHIDTTKEAATLARANRTVFHLVHTQRLHSHSKGDDTRNTEELERLWSNDALSNWLDSIPTSRRAQLEIDLQEQINQAHREATQLPPATIDYFDETQIEPSLPALHLVAPPTTPLSKRLNNTLNCLLKKDKKLLIFGEDVESPYGGAFKITEGLSLEHPEQVWNTPISESAITGKAIGLAMGGYKPIVEIMFADFLTLTLDQLLNSASKFSAMFHLDNDLPFLIRTPSGGRRGYGATHSQSLEKHFLGIPNLKVAAINYLLDEKTLQEIYTPCCPTLVIENKSDYSKPIKNLSAFNRLFCESSHSLVISPKCPARVTLLCYGGMLSYAEEAAAQLLFNYEIAVEIVCPIQLFPFNDQRLTESVNRTGKLLCVEEGTSFANFSSQCIAQLHANGIVFSSKMLSARGNIISSALHIELAQLPNDKDIISEILNWNHVP